MKDERAALLAVVRRLERLERIRTIVLGSYEYVDDIRQRVRRNEVVTLVARELGEVETVALHREVRAAVMLLGFQPVHPRNARMFRKCRKLT